MRSRVSLPIPAAFLWMLDRHDETLKVGAQDHDTWIYASALPRRAVARLALERGQGNQRRSSGTPVFTAAEQTRLQDFLHLRGAEVSLCRAAASGASAREQPGPGHRARLRDHRLSPQVDRPRGTDPFSSHAFGLTLKWSRDSAPKQTRQSRGGMSASLSPRADGCHPAIFSRKGPRQCQRPGRWRRPAA